MSVKQITDAIEMAQEVMDPVAEIIKRAQGDPATAFEDAALAVLGECRRTAPATYERVRQSLKDSGVSVKRLEDAMEHTGLAPASAEAKQADVLLELAAGADLFHSADRVAYADIRVGDLRQTWGIRSTGFKQWLTARFYHTVGGAPRSDAVKNALAVLEAKAIHEGTERLVFVRVAAVADRVYLDLCDATWRAVEIDRDGWRVVDEPPVRFRRAAGMKDLPFPARGGTIELLRPFLNVKTEEDFTLAVAWMLATLRGSGPYPILMLAGEQGSAKSTFAAIVRALLDPNTSALRTMPRGDRDLFIGAANAHILAFDNLSTLSATMSDALCRLATGGGFATRLLFSDGDEMLFNAVKPSILTAIEDIVARGDLADRALFITLQAIAEKARRSEADLWAEFEQKKALILGALLDCVAHGLRSLPDVKLLGVPRMADFAIWASACEGKLWAPGTFIAAYNANLDGAVVKLIDADAVASAVRDFMVERERWWGTASELLAILRSYAEPETLRTWPTSGSTLSNRLRRGATALRKIGVGMKFDDRVGKEGTRMVGIVRKTLVSPSGPSAPSAKPTLGAALDPVEASNRSAPIGPAPIEADCGDSADAADGTDGIRAALGTDDATGHPALAHALDDDADPADGSIGNNIEAQAPPQAVTRIENGTLVWPR